MKRVVVTGLGAVTPLGQSVPVFWQRLCAGERGLRRISRFDPTGLRNELGGEVCDWRFDTESFGLMQAPDLATQFLLQAAREAVGDAGLEGRGTSPRPTVGAVLSTNFGGGESWEEWCRVLRDGAPFTPPLRGGQGGDAVLPPAPSCARSRARKGGGNGPFTEFAFHTALGHLREVFGLEGPLSLLSIACASGAAAIGYALDLIRAGEATAMLAGGHDALAPTPLSGLSTLHTITAEDIRPFSADRSGTLFGEGAAVLMLEELEHARARGAHVYAEVLGSWQNNNAYHLTAPDPGGAGMARVLESALADAGLPPEQLEYINAHGTGTKPHDAAETEAIKTVLGTHAYEIPVSSIKGAIAHLMGAAGAIEAIATVQTIATDVVPPTVNYREPDPECDLNIVPNVAQEASVQYAATISAGVGGSNACVVFGPPPASEPGTRAQVPAASPRPTWRRVVITGVAPISAIGIGREDFAAGLREGREGRRPPERLVEGHDLPLLAECLDFVVEDYLESEKTYLDRCSELALAACALAWQDAGLDWRSLSRPLVGLCLGTAYGCLDSMQNMTDRVQSKGVRFGSPVIFTHSFANSPTSLAAIEYEMQGPTSTFCVGDVSAGSALDYAWRLVADGRAEVMLAGGVEALSLPLVVARSIAPSSGAMNRATTPGEGACMLVLESAEHAQARGAAVLAEIVACSLQEAGEGAAAKEPWRAPEQLGHTFGAALALDLAAGLLADAPAEFVVQRRDPAGCSAAITVRRLS
ncbi:beta-ketoacyl-[acyl-carrier-protein] synthase family protein [bacterium]|nr:beta-ketoacyl-[acyl-carrier-protein] synthase family protein [bacterium]